MTGSGVLVNIPTTETFIGSGEVAGGRKDKHEDGLENNQVARDRVDLPFHSYTA